MKPESCRDVNFVFTGASDDRFGITETHGFNVIINELLLAYLGLKLVISSFHTLKRSHE